MSEPTAAELEQQAESARARVADTAETIRSKLTAGQLFDEFSGYFTGGDLAGGLGNLKTQMRDNPIPVALIGAGMAWLALGRGMGGSSHAESHSPTPRGYRSGAASVDTAMGEASPGGNGSYASGHHSPGSHSGGAQSSGSHSGGSMMSGVKSALSGAASVVSSAASSISSTTGSVAGSMRSTARSSSHDLGAMADSLGKSMLSGRDAMRHGGASAGASAHRLMDQEPLIIAAIGVAVGAAVGAMLPATEMEKQELGASAEKLREQAGSVLDKGMSGARNVASAAYGAMKEEAGNQGLTTQAGSDVVAKVGEVLKSAAQSTEEAVRSELGADDQDHSGDRNQGDLQRG